MDSLLFLEKERGTERITPRRGKIAKILHEPEAEKETAKAYGAIPNSTPGGLQKTLFRFRHHVGRIGDHHRVKGIRSIGEPVTSCTLSCSRAVRLLCRSNLFRSVVSRFQIPGAASDPPGDCPSAASQLQYIYAAVQSAFHPHRHFS